MTARARVEHDFLREGVAIWLGRRADGGTTFVEPIDLEVTFTPSGTTADATTLRPSLSLPEDMARALLDALAAHFGGVSEVQTLRKDYLAERARVDKMIDHLTSARPSTTMGD